MTKEFETKSGAKIAINVAPFEAALNLWSMVQKAAASQRIGIDFLKDPQSLLTLILVVDSSEDFKAALWPCLMRCTRNNQKIDKSIFTDPEVRKEYYEILAPCVEENIRPFVESMFSEFNARLKQTAAALDTQKQP